MVCVVDSVAVLLVQIRKKDLTGDRLHTVFGLTGYVLKDENEEHFDVRMSHLYSAEMLQQARSRLRPVPRRTLEDIRRIRLSFTRRPPLCCGNFAGAHGVPVAWQCDGQSGELRVPKEPDREGVHVPQVAHAAAVHAAAEHHRAHGSLQAVRARRCVDRRRLWPVQLPARGSAMVCYHCPVLPPRHL